LLKIINNVARSAWKYFFFKKFELEQYINYLIEEIYEITDYNFKRITTITSLNYFIPVNIHFGKLSLSKSFTNHYIGFKLGSFTKTKKPFYFRSKKKRKCYKQINNTIIY
jgi:ribosomal protein S19